MSISTAAGAGATLKQSLAALQAGQESYAQFVTDLFTDLETLHGRLLQAEAQMALQRQQLEELRSPLAEEFQPTLDENTENNAELEIRVAELESERQALEEELENIRGRAVNMAEIIAGQKRQMSDEHVQWMTELRQLRRILDKQTKWITQQSDLAITPPTPPRRLAPLSAEHVASAVLQMEDEDYAAAAEEPSPSSASYAPPPHSAGGSNPDPVLGSVLSQFEILQKDVARRRKQK
ncbi:MAG TPA: hypothetical protein VFE46_07370 [Pirellulales bacterium]|nr:hypothetical protein [Pirellulales bacterium]